MSTGVTIGKLAEAAGVNVETIRYYQQRGLLQEPVKPLYGQRRYSLEQAKRVRFIKACSIFTSSAGCNRAVDGIAASKAAGLSVPEGCCA